MPPLIRLSSLTRTYRVGSTDVRALDAVDLEIAPGEFVAVTGASGSGKSTLLQMLGLLDRPTGGRYELAGVDTSKLDEAELSRLRAREIGFVFQFFNLLPRATALENVELPLIYAGRSKGRERLARSALEAVGLSDRAEHWPSQLSGGQQQRVAIARAVVSGPQLLLADEPTGNLPSEQSHEIMEQLKAMNERGITILLVTHEKEIAAYAGRELAMRDGRILSDQTRRKPHRAKPSPFTVNGRTAAAARLEENLEMALDALTANKLRTGLAALGIVIGVAALLAMVGLGAGARAALRDRIATMGANLLFVYPQRGPRRILEDRSDFTRLTVEDADAMEELRAVGVPIVRAAPIVQSRTRAVRGDRNWDTRVQGVRPAYAAMHNSAPKWGRFFTAQEDLARARVAVIGKTVADNLFDKDEDPVGQTIRVDKDYFRVVGLLPAVGGGGFSDRDDQILSPLETVRKRILGQDFVHYIEVQLEKPEASQLVQDKILELLRRRHNLPPHREDDFRVFDMAEVQETMSATTKIVSTLLGAIAAISLIVGGIGIMNIMLVSVKERTREIGLRKAMGARPDDILVQFLVEAGAIAAAGGTVGVAIGVGTAWAVTKFAGWPTLVLPSAVLIAFAFSTLTGVVFGLWPAKQAAKLPAAEALRYE